MEQHVQRYTKYIHEAVRKMDLDTATYKDHLHKVFEWYNRQPCTVLRNKHNRANITDELQKEHQYAHWIHNMKQAKKGKNHSRLYQSVEQRLIEAFGPEWHSQ